MKKALFGLALTSLLAASGAAGAATGGRVKDLGASVIYRDSLHVPANVGYTIRTSNLSAGADTILHLQNADDPNGGFVAGNDDYGGTLASEINLAPVSYARNLTVYLRSYGSGAVGTAILTRMGSDGAYVVNSVQFGGTSYSLPSGLVAGSHVMTVEQQGGSKDTVLLIVSGGPANAVASDDNDGVGDMSWLHTDSPCVGSYCRVIVGSLGSPTPGATSLVWDEDAHVAGCDADGAGNALELAIGTDPCNPDTDGDGLMDSTELIGAVESAAGPAVKLPAYGADPLKKDLFVELDWVECTAGSCASLDEDRVPGAVAAKVAAYFAPDIRVHMDTGVVNDDPATRTIWGSWGGATRIPAGTAFCEMLAPERVGMFHHGIIKGYWGGQAQSYNGYCFTAGRNDMGGPITHELAHGLGLYHGGSPQNDVLCKANYRSPMNYMFTYDSTLTQFSRNQFGSVVLNPLSVDEGYGLGTSDMTKIGYLKDLIPSLVVSPTGQIDWSRDGGYDAGITQAPVTWFGASCEQSIAARMTTGPSGAWTGSRHLVAGWVKAGAASRIYQISRRASDGVLQSRYALGSALATCKQNPVAGCAAWTPAVGSPPTVVPGSLGGTLAPAVARIPGATERLLVVYPDAQKKLRQQFLSITNNVETWTAPGFVGGGAEVVDSDPAVVFHGGVAQVLASTGGVLKRWTYTPATGAWTGPTTQQWSDNTSVVVQQGVGVTPGYQRNIAGEQLFAVMQVATPAPAHLVLARYDGATQRWVALPQSIWGGSVGAFKTVTRPGLAYVPFNPAVVNDGRFFIGVQPAAGASAQIAMTDGNDMTAGVTKRRLRWSAFPIHVFNEWQVPIGGVSLLFDRADDQSLRASWTAFDSAEVFAPLADGLFNTQLKDHDDYARMKQNLACALTHTCQ